MIAAREDSAVGDGMEWELETVTPGILAMPTPGWRTEDLGARTKVYSPSGNFVGEIQKYKAMTFNSTRLSWKSWSVARCEAGDYRYPAIHGSAQEAQRCLIEPPMAPPHRAFP